MLHKIKKYFNNKIQGNRFQAEANEKIVYLGMKIDANGWEVANGNSISKHYGFKDKNNRSSEIYEYLKNEIKNLDPAKIVGMGISYAEGIEVDRLDSRIWLELDIVPIIWTDKQANVNTHELARFAQNAFTPQGLAKVVLTSDREVIPSALTVLEEYKKYATDFKALVDLAEKFKNKRIVFFSATPQGGGVALMRHALIRLFRLLGVDAHWHVLSEDAEIFKITKTKFHNILQAVAPSDSVLTDTDIKAYSDWIAQNARQFQHVFKDADYIVIDDPQPSGLVPHIKAANQKAKIIYRSHIHIVSDLVDKPGTPQYTTWDFIWNNIKMSDCFVSHPINHFIPASVPQERVWNMPATSDVLDGLNKKLSAEQTRYYLGLFNDILTQTGQNPLDLNRPYFIQVARFDPSKGIPDLLEAYLQFRRRLNPHKIAPQLVVCGNGSVDDPEGTIILSLVMETLKQEKFKEVASDIKVARLPHVDQMLNALLAQSMVAFQLSHKEGFEIKVTEALLKDKPVVAYRAGGIPLQIEDGETGFLLNVGDTSGVSDRMFNLYTDSSLYKQLVRNIQGKSYCHLLTTGNAQRWLELFDALSKNEGLSSQKVLSKPDSVIEKV